MTNTPLPLLKAQLNIEHDLDDALLEHKLAAAEEWIGNFTGVAFREGEIYNTVPPSLTEAVLQLAAYWYGQREAVSDGRGQSIPFGVIELIRPYREEVTGHVAF